jgi:steroid delta-isomerase-like uncharacterized protein
MSQYVHCRAIEGNSHVGNCEETASLIREYVAACQARDYERIWTFYDDDIVYEDRALGIVNNGIEETKHFYYTTMSGLDVNWVVAQVHATDQGFGLEGYMEGVHVKDLPGMPATGRSFKVPCASIGEVHGGKITANRDYWNNYDLLKQLGLLPSAKAAPGGK